ncbi:MAG: lysylphosphatidylglycerol synthase transmembrane domain-containing protein [Anaerolineaceae bacterium]|jgi:uncharacterized protein (TIRG00374 family)
MQVQTEKNNRLMKIGLPILLSGLAIWLVWRQLDFQVLWAAFRQLSISSIALVILLFTLGLFLRGLTCWIILGPKFLFMDAFWAMNVGYLLNSFIPLRLGEFGRAAILTERSKGKASYMEALASIVAERFLDLLTGFMFLLVALLFLFKNDRLEKIAWIGFGGLAFSLVLMILLAKNRDTVISWFRDRFSETSWVQKRLVPALEQLLLGFTFFLDAKRFIPASLILAVSWFLSMLEYNVLQNAILDSSKAWWPVLVIPAGAFVNALPAAPGGLGVFEAGAVGAYALVGVGKEPALAMALIVHFVQIAIPSIFGIIALFISGDSLGSLITRSTRFQAKKEVTE